MGGKDSNFKVVYRGEPLEHFRRASGYSSSAQRSAAAATGLAGRMPFTSGLSSGSRRHWRRGLTTCWRWRASGRSWKCSTMTSLACRFER